MIVYLVPIVTMLAGAILISQWWSDDVAVFGASVAGFIAGLGLVKWHATVNRNNVSYQPLVSADEKARGGSPVTVINLP